MKPFDIEKAKQGKPVCNRAGENVRILCFDRKGEDYHIVALHTAKDGEELVCFHTSNGRNYKSVESELDLFMKTEKKTGFINVYKHTKFGESFNTKEEAISHIGDVKTYLYTAKIEWEE